MLGEGILSADAAIGDVMASATSIVLRTDGAWRKVSTAGPACDASFEASRAILDGDEVLALQGDAWRVIEPCAGTSLPSPVPAAAVEVAACRGMYRWISGGSAFVAPLGAAKGTPIDGPAPALDVWCNGDHSYLLGGPVGGLTVVDTGGLSSAVAPTMLAGTPRLFGRGARPHLAVGQSVYSFSDVAGTPRLVPRGNGEATARTAGDVWIFTARGDTIYRADGPGETAHFRCQPGTQARAVTLAAGRLYVACNEQLLRVDAAGAGGVP